MIGIQVEGAFFNEDDSKLSVEEFISKLESVGLHYGGYSIPIDDEGNVVDKDGNLTGDQIKFEKKIIRAK